MNGQRNKDVLLAVTPPSPQRNEGVARFARGAGWNLLVANRLMRALGGWRGDGALVTLRDEPELLELVRRLRRCSIPVVDLTAEHPEIRLPRVCGDNRAIGRLAAEHFIASNHRHAAWFSTKWTPVHADRFKGFAEAWTAADNVSALRQQADNSKVCEPPARWVLAEEVEAGRWDDSRATARWFEERFRSAPKPLALFCYDDADAALALSACRTHGVAVPEEFAVLGVGDDHLLCENQNVPLSSVLHDAGRVGSEGAALLARLMDGEAPPRAPILVPPKGVAVRASTDRIIANDPLVAQALSLVTHNLSRPWGVEQLAAALEVPPIRLHRRFVEELGHPPGEEIRRQRLARVRLLLRGTDLPLGEIARQCGFCHAQHLSNLFRRNTGLSPRAWRCIATCGGANEPFAIAVTSRAGVRG
ncbi:MAG: substrate-binding domain-containing protein [Kiritimatiellae bacterium]|nr:substrate-binding domain-containing protein [Kiritimatiellia bacterium]